MPQVIITGPTKLSDESPEQVKVAFENLSKLIKTHKRLITYFETIRAKLQAESPDSLLKRGDQLMTSPDAYFPSASDREWMRIIDQLIPHLTDWWQRLDMATQSAPDAGTWLDDPNEYAAKCRSIDLLKALKQLEDAMDGVLPRVIYEQKPDICAGKAIQAIALGQLPNLPAYMAVVSDAYDTMLALDKSGRMIADQASVKAKVKAKPKKKGRRRASKEDRKYDAQISSAWKQYKEAGGKMKDFAIDHELTVPRLKRILDREYKREMRKK